MSWARLGGLILAAVGLAADAPPAKAPDAARRKAVEQVDAALADAETKEDAAKLAALRDAAEEVRAGQPENVLVGELLGVEGSGTERDAAAWAAALRQARDLLAFEPQMEAPLPEGFPEPTPVGEIRVKEYPAYRLARTPTAASETAAFFTLFGHIQSLGIAMTAPVELTYRADGEGPPQEESMAFLYRSLTQGKPGRGPAVEVADVPVGSTVALGLPGEFKPDRIADARRRLEAWLKGHPDYVAAGPLRVMGYNGPNVPAVRRYFEVELPVRVKEDAKTPVADR